MRNSLRDDDRIPLLETLASMRREARRRIWPMTVLFVLTGLSALLVGWNWPKKYFATSTILVSEDNTIQKLMEGRAVATSVSDRVLIAREVIFSREVMDDILKVGGWLDDEPDAAQRAMLIEGIQARTVLGSPRENLIRIEYWDQDPLRAPVVAQRFADSFIAVSRGTQGRESREAYEFMVEQVALYRDKVSAEEAKLETWREAHPESRVEPTAVMEDRIGQLRRRLDLDQSRLDNDSARSASAERLSASASGATAVRNDPLALRIAAMQDELDAALLQFTEAHPQAVRIRRQLELLQQRQAQSPRLAPVAPAGRRVASSGGSAAVLIARIAATQREIDTELERARRAADPEAELAQLVRERDVARDLYQDLLRRQEYARLSASLDEEGRGLGLRIQESATAPTRAAGARFAHFAAGGLAAATALPLGLLFLFVRMDPNLRSAAAVQRRTGIPVIATVPVYWNSSDRRMFTRDVRLALAAVAATVIAFAVASVWKLVMAA